VKPIGRVTVPLDSLAAMRRRGGRWAAYQIQDVRSRLYRRLRFVQYGRREGTFKSPPVTYLKHYMHIGYVDLEDGVVRVVEQSLFRAFRSQRDGRTKSIGS
jgi:hypothetical protein